MMQVEYVELQSFIDKHYEKYAQDNPMDETIPMAVRKARWAYEHYYWLARQFYLTKAMNGGDWVRYSHKDHLIYLMPVQSFTQEERSQIPATFINTIQKEHVQVINDKLMQKWHSITSLSAYTTGSTSMQLLEIFLKVDYFPTLVAALHSINEDPVTTAPAFIPAYPITEHDPPEMTWAAKRRILSTCIEEDNKVVEKNIAEAWETKKADMPHYVRNRLPINAYATFHKREYFQELEKVMLQRKAKDHPPETTIHQLLLPYDINATPDVVA